LVSKYIHALRTSKYYEDFYAGRVLVHVSIYQQTRINATGACVVYTSRGSRQIEQMMVVVRISSSVEMDMES
jgi:hypothetical protein